MKFTLLAIALICGSFSACSTDNWTHAFRVIGSWPASQVALHHSSAAAISEVILQEPETLPVFLSLAEQLEGQGSTPAQFEERWQALAANTIADITRAYGDQATEAQLARTIRAGVALAQIEHAEKTPATPGNK